MKFLLGCNMKIVIIEGNELFVGDRDLRRGIFLGGGLSKCLASGANPPSP